LISTSAQLLLQEYRNAPADIRSQYPEEEVISAPNEALNLQEVLYFESFQPLHRHETFPCLG
jgi:hypothetical protein